MLTRCDGDITGLKLERKRLITIITEVGLGEKWKEEKWTKSWVETFFKWALLVVPLSERLFSHQQTCSAKKVQSTFWKKLAIFYISSLFKLFFFRSHMIMYKNLYPHPPKKRLDRTKIRPFLPLKICCFTLAPIQPWDPPPSLFTKMRLVEPSQPNQEERGRKEGRSELDPKTLKIGSLILSMQRLPQYTANMQLCTVPYSIFKTLYPFLKHAFWHFRIFNVFTLVLLGNWCTVVWISGRKLCSSVSRSCLLSPIRPNHAGWLVLPSSSWIRPLPH